MLHWDTIIIIIIIIINITIIIVLFLHGRLLEENRKKFQVVRLFLGGVSDKIFPFDLFINL